MKPTNAVNVLQVFEGSFSRLHEERINVCKAKKALELFEPGLLQPSLYQFHFHLCPLIKITRDLVINP